MRAPLDRQRPGASIFNDYILITAAAANDAWQIKVPMPGGDIAKNHMLYVINLSTESDFDVSLANHVEASGVTADALLETQHVSKAAATLFDKTAWSSCFKDKAGNLTDYSAEAENAAASDVIFDFTAENDALYFGTPTKSKGMIRPIGTAGVYDAEFVWEYYNGATWEELEDVQSASVSGVGDPAHPFTTTTGAIIKWTTPEDMAKINPAGNPTEQYWVRARVDDFTSITTAPRISRLWYMPAKNFNSYAYQIENLFNGNDACLVVSNETQITIPTRLQFEIREI